MIEPIWRPLEIVDEKKYGRLLAKYLPGVIRSDEEHDRLAGLLMKLSLAEERSAEEQRLIELLERLLDDYDEKQTTGKLEALDPLELVQHLMEEGGLKQVDLVDCFGSQSVVSAVMRASVGSIRNMRAACRDGSACRPRCSWHEVSVSSTVPH